MSKVELMKGVYWVGAIDWNVRNFHGYSTHRGSTYNAYLIVDEKIALIDTVKAPFYDEMAARVREIVSFDKIDYVISNHVEMDHSGSLPMALRDAKNARLVTLEKFGENGLAKTFHQNWSAIAVKEGSTVDLGKRKLTFIPTPMLHWPDSMCTYLVEDKLLFSMDAFGQHVATSQRFDDEVDMGIVMQEASKYYANILMPFGDLIVKAVNKLGGVKIDMIAPSHGVIWRSHINDIVQSYAKWGKGETATKALIIYDTMWGSTQKMALAIARGMIGEGVDVKLFNLTASDKSDVMKEVLDAKTLIIGSPTLNNGMFPSVAEFLCYLKGLKPKNKIGAVFGSHGWGGGGVKAMQQELEQTGVELIDSKLAFKFVPDEGEIQKCVDFGREMAAKIK
ncbi:MAG: FprA family A-type flavoprotein [Dehalococcoidia bacterium]|jgi:flavorubredoxin